MDRRRGKQRVLRWLAALAVPVALWQSYPAPLRARPPNTPAVFGVVRNGTQSADMRWEPAGAAVVTRDSLLLTTPRSVLRSKALPLRPGHLYAIEATIRRGPGTHDRFSLVFTDASGRQQSWSPVWQFPTSTRPNWVPLSPYPQRYVQSFIVPSDMLEAHFEIALEPSKPQLAALSALEMTRLELAEQQSVAMNGEPGPNRLLGGDMETVAANGLPAGWRQSQPGASNVQLVEIGGAPSGDHVLRVTAGTQALLSAPEVSVTRATAWRISLWARGRGHLQIMAQSLSNDRPVPRRIDDPQAGTFTLDARTWQQRDQRWFAEAPAIRSAEVMLIVTAVSDVELDSVEFRPYRGSTDSWPK